jgi:hypothetical protein
VPYALVKERIRLIVLHQQIQCVYRHMRFKMLFTNLCRKASVPIMLHSRRRFHTKDKCHPFRALQLQATFKRKWFHSLLPARGGRNCLVEHVRGFKEYFTDPIHAKLFIMLWPYRLLPTCSLYKEDVPQQAQTSNL